MMTSDAVRYFGSAAKLAQALGLKSRQAIYHWGEKVPELYQYKLAHLSGGELPLCVDLGEPGGAKQ